MPAFNRNYLSWPTLKETLWTDVVTLGFSGGDYARERYEYFSSPHPRMPLIPRKALGAALIDLSAGYDAYLKVGLRTIARKNIKLATKRGYAYATADALSVLDDIMEVNGSMTQRGGRSMDPLYADRRRFEAIARRAGQAHIVRSGEGRISAYALVPNLGDLWLVDYVLGHGDHLKNGVMYLLIAKILEEKFKLFPSGSHPRWVMYDTFLGAGSGLRQFKRVVGFAPYWVRWRWFAPHV